MISPPSASITVDGVTVTVRVSCLSAMTLDDELSVAAIDDGSKLESVPMKVLVLWMPPPNIMI